MKKLLVLLLVFATLAVGSVFAGPVHINGPGILAENTLLADISVERILSAATFFDLNRIDREFDIVGGIAGDFQGIYNYGLLGSIQALIIFPASVYAAPNAQIFVFEAVCQAQEVIPRMGYSRSKYYINNKMI
jgi:hypothetical protein